MILGLTGGIGSGKSTVAKLFSLLGWAHFNSDQVARELYLELPIRKKVIELLGESAYKDNNSINKSYISEKIFSNPQTLDALNHIIHPAVGEKFRAFLQTQNSNHVLKESALLFEAGLEKQVDKIVLVTAPEALRLQRVAQRDQLSFQQVKNKMKAQWPEEDKIKRSHFIVKNDEIHSLIEQVTNIHTSLLQL